MIKFTFTYEDDINKLTKEMKFPHLDGDEFSLSEDICDEGSAPFDIMYNAMRGIGFSDNALAKAMVKYALDNLLAYCSVEECDRIFREIEKEYGLGLEEEGE